MRNHTTSSSLFTEAADCTTSKDKSGKAYRNQALDATAPAGPGVWHAAGEADAVTL
jgi:hypothetical protein